MTPSVDLLHHLEEHVRLLDLDDPSEACEPACELGQSFRFHSDEHPPVREPVTLLAGVQASLGRNVGDLAIKEDDDLLLLALPYTEASKELAWVEARIAVEVFLDQRQVADPTDVEGARLEAKYCFASKANSPHLGESDSAAFSRRLRRASSTSDPSSGSTKLSSI